MAEEDCAGVSAANIPALIPIALAEGVTVHYTTRLGGRSRGDFAFCNLGSKGGDDLHMVAANRRAVDDVVGARTCLVSQVHSAIVADVDSLLSGFEADSEESAADMLYATEADALFTAEEGRSLGVFTADCLPVLLADPQAGLIAAVHCGRRGLMKGVLEESISALVAAGASRSRIVATLGPRICGDCYEVGEEIASDFDRRFPGTMTDTRFGGRGIDIALAALQILTHEGISGDRIVDSEPRVRAATYYLEPDPEFQELCRVDGEGEDLSTRLDRMDHPLCTLENPLWFSHRRSAKAGKSREGRMLAIVTRRSGRVERVESAETVEVESWSSNGSSPKEG